MSYLLRFLTLQLNLNILIDQGENIEVWCDECWKDESQNCLKSKSFGDELVPLITLKYVPIPKKTLIKLFVSFAVYGKMDVTKSGTTIHVPDATRSYEMIKYALEIEKNTNINVLKFWQFLNEPYVEESYRKEFLIPQIPQDLYSNAQIKPLVKYLEQPKIHGNYNEEMVLIPFCNFDSKILKPCEKFVEIENSFASEKKCYTFNYDGKYYGQGISRYKGLTFAVNYLYPTSFTGLEPVTVTVHPPKVVPYLDQFQATTRQIQPGILSIIQSILRLLCIPRVHTF